MKYAEICKIYPYLIGENFFNAKLFYFEIDKTDKTEKFHSLSYNTSIYLVSITVRNFANHFQSCYR